MTKTLRLSWTRFFVCFAILGISPALLIISGINDRNSWSSTAAAFLVYLSLMGFFPLGWSRLRREDAERPILVTETHRPRLLLIGPVVPAVVWFVSTVLVIIALAVVSALAGHAA